MVKLGDKVTDNITGYSGIAVARTEFLNGCVRIAVQPPIDKDGKLPLSEWIDEQQLQAPMPVVSEQSESKIRPGGPGIAPPSRDCPLR